MMGFRSNNYLERQQITPSSKDFCLKFLSAKEGREGERRKGRREGGKGGGGDWGRKKRKRDIQKYVILFLRCDIHVNYFKS